MNEGAEGEYKMFLSSDTFPSLIPLLAFTCLFFSIHWDDDVISFSLINICFSDLSKYVSLHVLFTTMISIRVELEMRKNEQLKSFAMKIISWFFWLYLLIILSKSAQKSLAWNNPKHLRTLSVFWSELSWEMSDTQKHCRNWHNCQAVVIKSRKIHNW